MRDERSLAKPCMEFYATVPTFDAARELCRGLSVSLGTAVHTQAVADVGYDRSVVVDPAWRDVWVAPRAAD